MQTLRSMVGSEVFIVRPAGSLRTLDMVEDDGPASGPLREGCRPPMLAADDDLTLLASRLKLGLPLRGFDGREIPLRSVTGACVGPIEAAQALLRSAASLLPADEADEFLATVCERAEAIERAACINGESPAVVAARVTGVLVSGAVRASVLARGHDVSPSAVNRATLSWYQVSDLRRRELLDAGATGEFSQLSA